ncbi:MucR family transcriptional regulator [Methylobacterium indicum]|uniref:MucR family transcriptional regulator n=1 Tax=Methylobacterium indicum TaxID=1775910 RepID=UPI0009E23388|nr:MucR family transcriptional regulator [Methylobacterium indicum]
MESLHHSGGIRRCDQPHALDNDLSTSCTARVLKASFTRNNIRPAELPALINPASMALRRSADRDTDTVAPGTPIVPVASDLGSVARDYFRNWDPGRQRTPAEIAASIQETFLVCFEDGKRHRRLKQHLRRLGLTPDDYRKKRGLPDDYPMKPAVIETGYLRAQAPARALTQAEIAASIQETYLVCFEDGKHYRMLSRHLRLYGLTPDDYRKKWGLPDDDPMLAAADRDHRSRFAVERKLGKYDRSSSKPRGPYVIKSKIQAGDGPAKPKEPSPRRAGSAGATKSTEGALLIEAPLRIQAAPSFHATRLRVVLDGSEGRAMRPTPAGPKPGTGFGERSE